MDLNGDDNGGVHHHGMVDEKLHDEDGEDGEDGGGGTPMQYDDVIDLTEDVMDDDDDIIEKDNTIDLTNDDYILENPYQPNIDIPIVLDYDDDDDNDDDNKNDENRMEPDVQAGCFMACVMPHDSIKGRVYEGEEVYLAIVDSDDDGDGDSSRIDVYNVVNSKVGLMLKDICSFLVPLLQSGVLRVEVNVCDSSNPHSIMVSVNMFCLMSDKDMVLLEASKYKSSFTVVRHKRDLPHRNQRQPSLTIFKHQQPGMPNAVNQSFAVANLHQYPSQYGVVTSHQQARRYVSAQEVESNLEMVFESAQQLLAGLVPMPTRHIRTPMKSYQLQGLHWMTERERQLSLLEATPEERSSLFPFWRVNDESSETPTFVNTLTESTTEVPPQKCRGGILADEMGLGKTIQVIALLLNNPIEPPKDGMVIRKPPKKRVKSNAKRTNRNLRHPTLIVSPLSVIPAWEMQLKEHPQYCVKFYRYHGPNRSQDACELLRYDAVLTTYSTVAQEYDATAVDAHDANRYEKEHFLRACHIYPSPHVLDELREYRVARGKCYTPAASDEHHMIRKGEVVLVCNCNVRGHFNGMVVRSGKVVKLVPQNSVVVKADNGGSSSSTKRKKRRSRRGVSPLFEIHWARVVLDEAHAIRVRTTLQSRAVASLRADCRWCVTGTPFQNKLDDGYSLLRFLRYSPFDDPNVWKSTIIDLVRNNDSRGLERLQKIMAAICLRRLKTQIVDGKAIVQLPQKEQRVIYVDLNDEERRFYDQLSFAGSAQMRRLVEERSHEERTRGRMNTVMELLLRMRQACCHVKLVPGKYFTVGVNVDRVAMFRRLIAGLREEQERQNCQLCLLRPHAPVIIPCNHLYCESCLVRHIEETGTLNCASCGAGFEAQFIFNSEIAKEYEATLGSVTTAPVETAESEGERIKAGMTNIVVDSEGKNLGSSKVGALIEQIHNSIREDEMVKMVVYSQWTSYLDLIEDALNVQRIRFVRLDGTMTLENRRIAMSEFESNSELRVFLISLNAGGTGITLTAANKVFFMDPWWNPAAEDQAVDRVHRLGQTKDVEIVRFITNNTVEAKIVELQERKRLLTEGAMEKTVKHTSESNSKNRSSRLQDLMQMFGDSYLRLELQRDNGTSVDSSELTKALQRLRHPI